ncbi:MAG: hypothetical protein K6C12_05825 [Oscillospiraceae bacterium]|nr:hypothetical protein [Oscillospiraceae bacterium]
MTLFDFNGDGTSDFVDYMIWKTEIVPDVHAQNNSDPFQSDTSDNLFGKHEDSSGNNPFSW